MFTYHIENRCILGNKIEINLMVCIGSLAESIHKSGMAHLFEHIFVHYLRNKINSMIKMQYKTQVSAYTEFNHMLFLIECHMNIFDYVWRVLMSALQFFEIDSFDFHKSKQEVIQECSKCNDKSIKQKEILKLLTDNKVRTLPIGEINNIENISMNEIHSFYIEKFCVASKLILVLGNAENMIHLNEIVYSSNLMCNQREKRTQTIKNKCISYSVQKIDRFIFIKYIGIRENLYNRVLWELLKDIIAFFYGKDNNTLCYEKSICNSYRYLYIKDIGKDKEFLQLDKLIKFISPQVLFRAIKMFKAKFDYAEKNQLFISPEYLRNEYVNYYLYGDCMMIPSNINDMSSILFNINESSVVQFINKIWKE